MKISVIIPAYNEQKNLPKIIRALRKQSYKDFEIIVVDNNSTDNTYNVAKKLADKVYKCKEQGISPARNFGAKRSKAEIIAFLDADSIPCVDWVKIIKESFEKHKNQSVITGLDLYEYNKFLKRITLNFFARMVFNYGLIRTHFGKITIIANNIAIKRNLFIKIKGFDKLVVEDHYFSLKLQKLGNIKCLCDKKMLVTCSSRRIKKLGILKTYYLWFKSTLKEVPIESYKLHDKI